MVCRTQVIAMRLYSRSQIIEVLTEQESKMRSRLSLAKKESLTRIKVEAEECQRIAEEGESDLMPNRRTRRQRRNNRANQLNDNNWRYHRARKNN